jgi:protein dispatched 1
MFLQRKERPPPPHKNNGKKKKKKEKIKFNKKIKFINKLNALNATANYDLVNFEEYDDNETFSLRHDHYDYGKNLSFVSEDANNKQILAKKKQWQMFLNQYPPQTINAHVPTDGFFCESPSKYDTQLMCIVNLV